MDILTNDSFLRGEVTAPASKSYLHRALIAASLANSETVISDYSLCNDVMDTINVLRSLGVTIELGKDIVVKPTNYTNNPLRIRESGTTYRLMIPVLGAFFSKFNIDLDPSLRSRPISEYEKFGLVRANDVHSFDIKPGEYEIDGSVSSQYISGLLMALPLLDSDSVVRLVNPTSANYIEMTLKVLADFGILVERIDDVYLIKGNQTYKGCNYKVEPDFSAMIFWAVAGVIRGDILVNAPHNSLQPDYEIVKMLGEETIEGFRFRKRKLDQFDISIKDCPDSGPALAVLGACSNGVSYIRDAERLAFKESDRINEILKLKNFDVDISFKNDFRIKQSKLKAGTITQNDHRIAMMAAILPVEVLVKNAETVEKSYPEFFSTLAELGGVTNEL